VIPDSVAKKKRERKVEKELNKMKLSGLEKWEV